jgi:hypothetical protein
LYPECHEASKLSRLKAEIEYEVNIAIAITTNCDFNSKLSKCITRIESKSRLAMVAGMYCLFPLPDKVCERKSMPTRTPKIMIGWRCPFLVEK